MAFHTDSNIGDAPEADENADLALPLPRLNPYPDYPKQFGPLEVHRNLETLSLRRENQGGLSWESYLLFGVMMLSVTILGLLSVVQSDQAVRINEPTTSSQTLAQTHNSFAFLWLFGIMLMLVGIPLYVARAYRAALVFTFDKAAGAIYQNKQRITALQRLEYVAIRETRDPDDRYLYLLQVMHTDGHELLLYNGYDKREVLNIANEIVGFLSCRLKYTGSKNSSTGSPLPPPV